MSARDLASLRALTNSPPLPGGDDGAEGSELGPGYMSTPRVTAFAIDKEHGVNFRSIAREKGERYRRVIVEQEELSEQEKHATAKLREAIALREKWVYCPQRPEWVRGPWLPEVDEKDPKEPTPMPHYDPFNPELPEKSAHTLRWEKGVAAIPELAGDTGGLSYEEFARDMEILTAIVDDPEVRTFTWRRLKLGTEKATIYGILNGDDEMIAQKKQPHRDFYNTIKVDTHVHHSSCANVKVWLARASLKG